jgi:hypothetical protein
VGAPKSAAYFTVAARVMIQNYWSVHYNTTQQGRASHFEITAMNFFGKHRPINGCRCSFFLKKNYNYLDTHNACTLIFINTRMQNILKN